LNEVLPASHVDENLPTSHGKQTQKVPPNVGHKSIHPAAPSPVIGIWKILNCMFGVFQKKAKKPYFFCRNFGVKYRYADREPFLGRHSNFLTLIPC